MDRLDARQQLASSMCGVGLILILVGFWIARFLPMQATVPKQEYELRSENSCRADLQSVHEPSRTMGEWPGALVLTTGFALLTGGLVLWFRDARAKKRAKWTSRNEDV